MDVTNKPYPDFMGCEGCTGYHPFLNEKCPVCNLCFAYCVRDVGCKWYNPPTEQVQAEAAAKGLLPEQQVKPEVKAQVVANQNIQEAVECWLASSSNVSLNCDIETAFNELEMFLKEILTPVDKERTYFALDEVDGDVKFRRLDADKLMKNQDGVYVIVEGRKRTRIGKNVAVMGL